MPEKYCPECGTEAIDGQRFCRECGAELAHSVAMGGEPETDSAHQADFTLSPKRGGGWVYLLGGIALLGILAAIAMPSHHGARPQARKKACVSNMKTIEGAVELYLMEKKISLGTAVDLKSLTREGYLKTTPQCPGGGAYTIRCNSSSGSVPAAIVISCSIHRTIDDTTSGL